MSRPELCSLCHSQLSISRIFPPSARYDVQSRLDVGSYSIFLAWLHLGLEVEEEVLMFGSQCIIITAHWTDNEETGRITQYMIIPDCIP